MSSLSGQFVRYQDNPGATFVARGVSSRVASRLADPQSVLRPRVISQSLANAIRQETRRRQHRAELQSRNRVIPMDVEPLDEEYHDEL